MYPRSGFWYRGKAECSLAPVCGAREHPANHPFGNHPFANPETPTLKMLDVTTTSTLLLSARPSGRTTTHVSKKGSAKVLRSVLGRVLRKDSEKGACYGFGSKKLEGF